MSKAVLASIATLLAGGGLVIAQELLPPIGSPPSPTPSVGQSSHSAAPNAQDPGAWSPPKPTENPKFADLPRVETTPVSESTLPPTAGAVSSTLRELSTGTASAAFGAADQPEPVWDPHTLPGAEPWTAPALPPEVSSPWSGLRPPPAAGYRAWIGAEALLWWERNEPLPSNLVTSGLATDAIPGALGQPNTLVLSGPGSVNFGTFGGVRAFAGGWLDPQQIIGLEASGFVLQRQGQSFNFGSTAGGNPLLALRHLDVPTGAEDAFVIAAPAGSGAAVGPFAGAVAVNTNSQLWGADANVLHALYWTRRFYLVGLVGFRYLDLSESAAILTRQQAIGGTPLTFLNQNFAAPAFALTDDQFRARSQFFGGQLGLRGNYYFSHFFVGIIGKIALGRTDEVANVLGASTLQPGNALPQSATGGLYALPSNSGRTLNQDFGVVPEVQVKVGVLLTRWLRATVGYDYLYWSRVMRAGSAMDLNVDTRQVPTSTAYQAGIATQFPRPMGSPTSFWAQGLTFGLEFTF